LEAIVLFLIPMRADSAFEHTIERQVETSGTGLHTGVQCRLRMIPAPSGTGVVFRRTDLDGFEVEARAANIARVSYATSLMKKGVLISTTEHLLAALYACGIDNVAVELDNLELPILDGSAQPFVELIRAAGRVQQRRRRRFLEILRPIEVSEGDPGAPNHRTIGIYPPNGRGAFEVDITIDFTHPLIGRQQFRFEVDEPTFAGQVSPARTFCRLEEVEQLRQMGLIRGGSLDCAIVLTRDGLMNPAPLRFPDEFCRHKALDLIGDLALVGRRIVGRVVAHKAGHALHTALVLKLLRARDAWREITAEQAAPAPRPRAEKARLAAAR